LTNLLINLPFAQDKRKLIAKSRASQLISVPSNRSDYSRYATRSLSGPWQGSNIEPFDYK